MKKYVIILACGNGSRMQSETPKQYMLLNNKPIVFHTIEKIYSFDKTYNIIVVINEEHITLFNDLKKKYNLNIPITTIYGGKERFFSVKNALDKISDTKSLVAVHDGVRPIVDKKMFEEGFADANQYGNAICGIKSTDSVRIKDANSNYSIDRTSVILIQTPQIFRTSILKKAYAQNYKKIFTDDASVVESIGEKIHIIEGKKENIKITFPLDLDIATQILNKKQFQ